MRKPPHPLTPLSILPTATNEQHPNKVVPGAKGALGLLALGTDRGHVSVWDLTRGVLAARLGEVSERETERTAGPAVG